VHVLLLTAVEAATVHTPVLLSEAAHDLLHLSVSTQHTLLAHAWCLKAFL
jgi:hypothetical protein